MQLDHLQIIEAIVETGSVRHIAVKLSREKSMASQQPSSWRKIADRCCERIETGSWC